MLRARFFQRCAQHSRKVPHSSQRYFSATAQVAVNSLSQSPEVIRDYQSTWLESKFDFATNHVVDLLEVLHFTAGLPWWAAIGGSAFCFRMAFFPALVHQIQQMVRFAQATPELAYTNKKIEKLKREKKSWQKEFRADVKAIIARHNIKFRRIFYYPVALIGTFIPFCFASRKIIFRHDHDLAQGGFGWFQDLSQPDIYCILPISCICLTYIVLGLYTGRAFDHLGKYKSWMFRLMFTIQSFELCLIPFIIDFPAGIMMYWGTSAMVGILHKIMLRADFICKIYGLPYNRLGGPLNLDNDNDLKEYAEQTMKEKIYAQPVSRVKRKKTAKKN